MHVYPCFEIALRWHMTFTPTDAHADLSGYGRCGLMKDWVAFAPST